MIAISRSDEYNSLPKGCLKRKVILVTDGDLVAKKAVETASRNIGARCISCSAGNPTRLSGEQSTPDAQLDFFNKVGAAYWLAA